MSRRPIPVLVLAAGTGERLRPLSYVRAKPALPLAGEALIRRIVRWLVERDVRRVVVNLHHLPHTIARVLGDGSDLGATVRYSWESKLLGSAGGPRRALSLLDAERFFVLNGDTLPAVDLSAMADVHAERRALVSMALVPNPDPQRYGGVAVDERGWVREFRRAGDPRPSLHFVGTQICEGSVFASLPDGERAESVNGVYRSLLAGDRPAVFGYRCDVPFADIGTPDDYVRTSLELAGREGRPRVAIGRGCRIHSSAVLVRTIVWDDVEIREHASLADCVVADGVTIPAGMRLERAAIVRRSGRTPTGLETAVGDLLVAPLSPAAPAAGRPGEEG